MLFFIWPFFHRFSGITEQMLKNTTTTLHNVQAVLLSMFNSETILVGHSLESDFKALKLIHDVVVDTSVLYPHKMGPPKKRALKTLCIENLKKIIQENGKLLTTFNRHLNNTNLNLISSLSQTVGTTVRKTRSFASS